MKTLIESMTVLETASYKIRVWRQEEKYDVIVEHETFEELTKIIQEISLTPSTTTRADIAALFIKVDRVNAVEVLNTFGNGCVFYKDWP